MVKVLCSGSWNCCTKKVPVAVLMKIAISASLRWSSIGSFTPALSVSLVQNIKG